MEYVNGIVAKGGKITEVLFTDLSESMRNGGGPGCLRLRVVLNEEEKVRSKPYFVPIFDRIRPAPTQSPKSGVRTRPIALKSCSSFSTIRVEFLFDPAYSSSSTTELSHKTVPGITLRFWRKA